MYSTPRCACARWTLPPQRCAAEPPPGAARPVPACMPTGHDGGPTGPLDVHGTPSSGPELSTQALRCNSWNFGDSAIYLPRFNHETMFYLRNEPDWRTS